MGRSVSETRGRKGKEKKREVWAADAPPAQSASWPTEAWPVVLS